MTPNPVQRVAMLKLWDDACAYCKQPLFAFDMHVDHIWPRSWSNAEVGSVATKHSLPHSLDVHDLENQAPAHPRCNQDKGVKPLPDSHASAELIRKAMSLAPEIRKLAQDLQAKDKVARAVALVWGEVEAGSLGSGSATTIAELRDLLSAATASLFVTPAVGPRPVEYTVIAYPGPTGERTVRRAWVVGLDDAQSGGVVVVVEDPSDKGSSIQNAAERIALAVDAAYPGYLTVLHYDNDKDPQNFWMAVPLVDGRGVFGEDLHDFPHAARRLQSVGLL